MFNEVLVKLVIFGTNPAQNEYSVGVVEGQVPSINSTELESVIAFSQKFIKAPTDWYVVRKKTFLVVEKSLYLIYSAVVPHSMKLENAEWLSFSKIDSLSETDRQIVLEGVG